MRRFLIAVILFLTHFLSAASVTWTGIQTFRVDYLDSDKKCYQISGEIHDDTGANGTLTALLYGHTEEGAYYLKSYDYSQTTAPVLNSWVLAYYSQILGPETFADANAIQRCLYEDNFTDGTLVIDPSDFYLGFVTSEYGVENGRSWYGWAHVSIDEEKNMNVLAAGVNLDGGAVVVGSTPTPEPSSALLLLLGLGMLGLRRGRLTVGH